MNKYLIRCVSLLLLPCLLADPTTAQGLAAALRSSSKAKSTSHAVFKDRFQEEALALVDEFVDHVLPQFSLSARHMISAWVHAFADGDPNKKSEFYYDSWRPDHALKAKDQNHSSSGQSDEPDA